MMKCMKGYEIKVLDSFAGFYIGTVDEEGLPNCRLSEEYYKIREDAELALRTGDFTTRNSVENMFCNGNKSCVLFKTRKDYLAEEHYKMLSSLKHSNSPT